MKIGRKSCTQWISHSTYKRVTLELKLLSLIQQSFHPAPRIFYNLPFYRLFIFTYHLFSHLELCWWHISPQDWFLSLQGQNLAHLALQPHPSARLFLAFLLFSPEVKKKTLVTGVYSMYIHQFGPISHGENVIFCGCYEDFGVSVSIM